MITITHNSFPSEPEGVIKTLNSVIVNSNIHSEEEQIIIPPEEEGGEPTTITVTKWYADSNYYTYNEYYQKLFDEQDELIAELIEQ